MAPLFQCKRHAGSCRDVVRGAPCVLVFRFIASDEAFLKAVIVLDVLIVERLLILVKLADSFDLLCDRGGRLLGAAAFGPIVRIALGLPWGSLSPTATFRPCSASVRSRRRRKPV